MRGSVIKFTQGLQRRSRVMAVLGFGIAGLALSGCVVYPSNGYGYGGGYYAAPAIYAPPVAFNFGYVGGWGGGWGHGGGWCHGGWH